MKSINTIRKDIITQLIKNKYGDVLSESELNVKISNALSSIFEENNIITNKREQSGITNADDIKNTTNELYIDLYTALKYLEEISYEELSELDNLLSVLIVKEGDVKKLNNIINDYNDIIINKGNPILSEENFEDSSCFESDNKYYTTRYGDILDESVKNIYDNKCFNLTLHKNRETNVAYYGNGILAANIYITKQYSNIDCEENIYDIKDILNTDKSGIWKQDIYTDKEITIKDYNSNYNITNGALCELVIDFESVSVINELRISNISKYPLDVLNIRYSLVNSGEINEINLLSKNSSSEFIGPKVLKNTLSLKFKNIKAKKIYIVLRQKHFEREEITYDISDKLISNIKNSISSNQNYYDKDTIFKAIYKDLDKDSPEWTYINSIMNNNQKLKLEDLLKLSNLGQKSKIKYHYSYGLSEILPLNNEFDTIGIFVTKKKICKSNINKIRIFTEEEHPKNEDGNIITDIEYYISYTESNRYDNWIPILPVNKTRIYCENLEIYDFNYCYLRFKTTESNIVSVKINGMIMEKYLDYTLHKDEDDNVIGIEIPDFDIKSIYTIEYIPNEDARYIDLSNLDLITDTIEFESNKTSRFILPQNVASSNETSTSYITDITVSLYQTSTGKSINDIENVTDKYDAKSSFKKFDNSGKWQFYYYKNNVFLNNEVPKGYKVRITYKHNINSFRLKAILRRNSKYNKYITPVLKNIKYEISLY